VRLEYVMKLASTGELFERRIRSLAENDEVAHSNFLGSRNVGIDRLKKISAALMPEAFAATANISQCRRAEQESQKTLFGRDIVEYRKEVSEKAEVVFKDEHATFTFLNEWADAQRESLKPQRSQLSSRIAHKETFGWILFGVGFFLALLEKAWGKPNETRVPGEPRA
jgi:hypothetical protein